MSCQYQCQCQNYIIFRFVADWLQKNIKLNHQIYLYSQSVTDLISVLFSQRLQRVALFKRSDQQRKSIKIDLVKSYYKHLRFTFVHIQCFAVFPHSVTSFLNKGLTLPFYSPCRHNKVMSFQRCNYYISKMISKGHYFKFK